MTGTTIAVRALMALGAGIAGALGPYWLYGRARAHGAEIESKLRAAEQQNRESTAYLAQALENVHRQAQAIRTLQDQAAALEARLARARLRNDQLDADNRQALRDLAAARIPSDAAGAMDWLRMEMQALGKITP